MAFSLAEIRAHYQEIVSDTTDFLSPRNTVDFLDTVAHDFITIFDTLENDNDQ